MPRKTTCKSPLDPLETCESPAKDMPVAATSESNLRKSGVLKYELLLLMVSIIWGSAFAAQQIGMQKGLGPMTFNGLRFAIGCLALIPVIIWRRKTTGHARAEEKLPRMGSAAAGVFLFAAASFQQIGLQYTSSANSGFITGFYILFVPVIGMFFGHKASKSLWAGILVCLVGFYLLSVSGDFVVSKGDLLTVICAVLWACQILIIDHVAGKGNPIQIAFLQFAICAVLSLAAGLLFENCTFSQIKAASGAIAYAGIMSVGIAFTLQVVCQKRCPPGPAAILMSLEAVFAAMAGYVILNQTLSGRAVVGCGLILCGVLIVQMVPMRRRTGKERRNPCNRKEAIRRGIGEMAASTASPTLLDLKNSSRAKGGKNEEGNNDCLQTGGCHVRRQHGAVRAPHRPAGRGRREDGQPRLHPG
jgi:drug/metabolite transporter (DMT)-like permease